jgi:hypothetical protein
VTRAAHRYPPQAVLLYVALGIALGMVGWALWIHDSGDDGAGQVPGQQTQGHKRGNGGERP